MDFVTERKKFVDVYPDKAAEVAQRLKIKKDDLEIVVKYGTSETVESNPYERSVVSYITTGVKDRDGEVILPDGLQEKHFRENPVVPFGHDYHSLPVAKNMWLRKDGKGILAKTVFANSAKAEEVYRAYTEDIGGSGPLCRAWSIGFIPIEWEEPVQKAGDDTPRRIYKKWELLEYSAVPIPSCPEALTLAVGKGIISAATAKEFNPDLPGTSATITAPGRPISREEAIKIAEGVLEKAEREREEVAEAEAKAGGVKPDETVTKPEVTENYIRIPVDKGDHSGHKIRTMSLSDAKGIKSLYCVDCKKIITYLFDKDKWTMETARAWVNDHKEIHDTIAQAVYEDTMIPFVVNLSRSDALRDAMHDETIGMYENILGEILDTQDMIRALPAVVQEKQVFTKVEQPEKLNPPAAIPLDKEMVKQVALDILKAIPPEELRKQINEGIALAVDKLRGKVR